ncbi:MAG: hypothetical protein WA741_31680 [Candidatus Sulfotelmatobacter sp.]
MAQDTLQRLYRLGVRGTSPGGCEKRRQVSRMAGAASVSDGVWMYQLTDKGLAGEITAKSTKYYKGDDLN